MSSSTSKFSLQEFLAMPESNERFELVDGEIAPKVSPKYIRYTVSGRLLRLVHDWCYKYKCGRVCLEWSVVLQRQRQHWVPLPDLIYVSYKRLPLEWEEDEPCPVPPELVIEIISSGQSFVEMIQKATDYLQAGVSRIWVADVESSSITVLGRSQLPQTFEHNSVISDPLLPGLELDVSRLFSRT